jgi:uncharacterized membrane protein YagU involved in acid resistance
MTTLEPPFKDLSAPAAAPAGVGPRAWELVLIGGPLLALLDILNAMGFWYVAKGVPPQVILQSIASGVLGRAAFGGGPGSAWLGANLHLLIAFAIAGVFWLGCRRWPALYRRPWAGGPAYGVAVYLAMHQVVVPLSRAATGPFNFSWFMFDFAGHLLLVGLPLALIARGSERRAQRVSSALPAGGPGRLR